MKINTFCKRMASLVLAGTLCVGLQTAALAQEYNDFDYITSHVNLKRPSGLKLTRPTDDITTSASAYFITGVSDPNTTLYMNGKAVTSRGSNGAFGVFVALDQGVNEFSFQQEGQKNAVVYITRGSVGTAATTNSISSMAPSYDCATMAGKTINLSCVAPSGASVTATVGGRKVQLEQAAATAKAGVPATFTGKTTAGDVQGTQNLGPVTYTLTYNGKTTTYKSAGSVYLTGSKSTLMVQVKNNAASVYQDAARSAFIETAKLGAVDAVVDIGSTTYQLSSGGWIPKDSVQPLTENVMLKNKISDLSYERSDKGEKLVLYGTSFPMFRADQDSEKLYVKLFHTTGIDEETTLKSSELFSDFVVTEKDGTTTLEFMLSGERSLWGYDISYANEGGQAVTTIYAKYRPATQGGNQPLAGVTVVVDAGHGGTDPGAIGVAGTNAAMEKDINLASAIAVQKRLESLGADVVMTRSDDSNPSLNDRMTITQNADADFFVSLHCNSIGYDQDANKPSGTEVYYFNATSKKLAANSAAYVANYTGRTARGAKLSNYRVTLNTYAPSVLIEMGFLTNPAEYDSMTSRRGIYNTANAVGDSIIASLK